LAVVAAILVDVSIAPAAVTQANGPGSRTYTVTITNLTSSQPLSPPLIATHSKRVDVFTVGKMASEGIRLIAENGDNSVLAAALNDKHLIRDVREVVATDVPVHRAGGPGSSSLTITIDARGNANRLSLATMLICTNDGFTGLDGVKLPGGFAPVTYYAGAYDAGTEMNDEIYTHIVDPCGAIGPVMAPPDGMNLRTPTNANISMHLGIQGGDDLTAAHDWTDPVVAITIQRVH
jgi:hypothetical protein